MAMRLSVHPHVERDQVEEALQDGRMAPSYRGGRPGRRPLGVRDARNARMAALR